VKLQFETEKAKRECREGVPDYRYGGPVIDTNIIGNGSQQTSEARRPDLAAWVWQYGVTDRVREPTPAAGMDTMHIYYHLLSRRVHMPRTFDIDRQVDTTQHTTWVGLLEDPEPPPQVRENRAPAPTGAADKPEVERILSHRTHKKGGMEYLAQYVGGDVKWIKRDTIAGEAALTRYEELHTCGGTPSERSGVGAAPKDSVAKADGRHADASVSNRGKRRGHIFAGLTRAQYAVGNPPAV
jgi:hypothetical protein